jgi:hypothetical protein
MTWGRRVPDLAGTGPMQWEKCVAAGHGSVRRHVVKFRLTGFFGHGSRDGCHA